MSQPDIPSYKVTLVGPTNVGKTSILMRVDDKGFDETSVAPTTSMQCHPHTYTSDNGTTININFWDTAGQEQFKSLGPMYYRNASYCIAVFDLTNDDSFNQMKEYIQMYKENNETENCRVSVVGNKIDLLEDQNKTAELITWANQEGYSMFLTSAKTGEGIVDLVHEVVESLVPVIQENQTEDVDIAIEIREAPSKQKKGCC